jgi:molybdenum cofactor biosynthesis enzyme MoaA
MAETILNIGERFVVPGLYIRHLITSDCNAFCPECSNEGQAIQEKRGGTALNVLDLPDEYHLALAASAINTFGSYILTYVISGGEPLLKPQLVLQLVKLLKARNIPIWLNTNGWLLGRYVDQLQRCGLQTVKVHLPTLDPEKYALAMGVKRGAGVSKKLIENTVVAILACLEVGMQVDINIPLMAGITANKKTVMAFHTLPTEGVRLKFLGLDQGVYGTPEERLFYEQHRIDPLSFLEEIEATKLDTWDHGRGGIYEVSEGDKQVTMIMVDTCSPERTDQHPYAKASFHLTADGHLNRMWEHQDFVFDLKGHDLETQWRAAMEYYDVPYPQLLPA